MYGFWEFSWSEYRSWIRLFNKLSLQAMREQLQRKAAAEKAARPLHSAHRSTRYNRRLLPHWSHPMPREVVVR